MAPVLLAASALWSGAEADVLTCATFKDRLGEALHAQTAAAPLWLSFTPTAARPGAREAWREAPNISGRLTCGPGDAFADFYMAIDPASGESAPPADLTRFKQIGAASLCALSDASPQACQILMAKMVDDGLDEYTEDRASKDAMAQSLQDYDFAKGLDATFYVTSRATSWAIGPGLATAVDATRPAFTPIEHEFN